MYRVCKHGMCTYTVSHCSRVYHVQACVSLTQYLQMDSFLLGWFWWMKDFPCLRRLVFRKVQVYVTSVNCRADNEITYKCHNSCCVCIVSALELNIAAFRETTWLDQKLGRNYLSSLYLAMPTPGSTFWGFWACDFFHNDHYVMCFNQDVPKSFPKTAIVKISDWDPL